MSTATRMSLDDFLALGACEPELELIDGEAVQKPVVGKKHSQVVSELVYLLKAHDREKATVDIDTELRHVHHESQWVFLPDVSATLRERLAGVSFEESRPVEVLPDLAVEALSPDDRPGRVAQKIAHYMQSGVRLLWVIDPETRQVTIWRPGEPPRTAGAGETIDASPVLPDFRVDLGVLFGDARE